MKSNVTRFLPLSWSLFTGTLLINLFTHAQNGFSLCPGNYPNQCLLAITYSAFLTLIPVSFLAFFAAAGPPSTFGTIKSSASHHSGYGTSGHDLGNAAGKMCVEIVNHLSMIPLRCGVGSFGRVVSR
jgi:hypothetical protein